MMDKSDSLLKVLSQGVDELGVNVTAEQQLCLVNYLNQLYKWNKAYNLSGIKDLNKMLRIHILDSLSILPYIQGKLILDVGTGAGLPGFVLAICCPEKKFILLDSNGKKTRFIFQTATKLKIDNIEVVHGRIEDFKSNEQVDIVLSRAFSSLLQYVELIQDTVSDDTKIMAMKGIYPEAEVEELPAQYNVTETHVLGVPGEEAQRHLLVIEKHK